MYMSAIEKYAILKEFFGPLVRIEVDANGGWTVPTQCVSVLTSAGAVTWMPSPVRDWVSAIEDTYRVLTGLPVSRDLEATWQKFDKDTYVKSHGQKVVWSPYNFVRSDEIPDKSN